MGDSAEKDAAIKQGRELVSETLDFARTRMEMRRSSMPIRLDDATALAVLASVGLDALERGLVEGTTVTPAKGVTP